jgi:hypothetical protein
MENQMRDVFSIRRIAFAMGASAMLATAMIGGAFAATDNGTTSATVDAMISVAAPASIDFGNGVPGDVLTVLDSTVTVVSNNAAGYTLAVQASGFTGTPAGTIPATALQFRNGVTAYASIVAVDTDLLLATTSAMTTAGGTDHLIDAKLTLPFVQAGAYAGTFIFTASNI